MLFEQAQFACYFIGNSVIANLLRTIFKGSLSTSFLCIEIAIMKFGTIVYEVSTIKQLEVLEMKFASKLGLLVSTLAIVFVSACANVNSGLSAAQVDGLAPVSDSKFKEFYRKPNTDFSKFSQIRIEPCKVNFRKNWQRDQNTNHADLSNRVTEKDVSRILSRTSDSCSDHFQESFEQSTAYKLVDSSGSGNSVLILRPSIIDLDVNAPELRGAGFNQTFTQSSGVMTLSVDVVDGATGKVLARAIDRRRDSESHHFESTSSVTNQADFDRVIRRWAKQLRDGLDQATL